MNCHSKKIVDSVERIADSNRKLNSKRYTLNAKKAFTLLETITALAILALVSSSVLVVINRCMTSAADSVLRMRAFEVARENMEKLLTTDSVSTKVEYGISDKYPEIQWQTSVDASYESLTKRIWLTALCSAQYIDAEGQEQTVEFTHWLTNLTKEQLLKIIEKKQKDKETEGMKIIVSYKGRNFDVVFKDNILTIGQQEFTFDDKFLEEYKEEDEIDLEKLAVAVLGTLDDDEFNQLVPVPVPVPGGKGQNMSGSQPAGPGSQPAGPGSQQAGQEPQTEGPGSQPDPYDWLQMFPPEMQKAIRQMLGI